MKIYIASPYITLQELNQVIYERLTDAGNEVFLPKSINIDAITEEEKKFVSERCYKEIDQSDLILIVYPFGISVSCEAGYSICQKKAGNHRKIVLFMNLESEKLFTEAMFIPYIDFKTNNMEDLIDYVNKTNLIIAC